MECSVCLSPLKAGVTFYTTGYKCGRNPKKPDERTYCGDDCRAFGRLHPTTSLKQLPVIWKREQNYIHCSNQFLYVRPRPTENRNG